jgi:hypothetical protein
MTEPCSKENEIQKILDALYGNGNNDGIKTQLALVLQKLKDHPTPMQLKIYAFFGGGASVFVAWTALIIFRALGGPV